MSLLSGVDFDSLIDNGLKTAEFIQKNKALPPETYGRSAIGEPKIPERIAAWEYFNRSGDGVRDGAANADKIILEAQDGSSEDNIGRNRTTEDLLPYGESGHPRPSTAGNQQARDAEDPNATCKPPRPAPRVSSRELAPSWNTITEGDSKSERSSESSQRSIWDAEVLDEEQGALADRGGNNRERIPANISDADPDSLESMLTGGTKKKGKKLTSTSRILSEIPKSSDGGEPIKKGEEESCASASSGRRQSSENGILHLEVKRRTDDKTQDNLINLDDSAIATPTSTCANCKGQDIAEIHSKVDAILENQNKILAKLNSLAEIKEEIGNIKVTLANHSLALSTLDGYINDLMIIIPSSGTPQGESATNLKSEKTRNPDLKMVIGRDKRRGLKDPSVLMKIPDVDRTGEDIFYTPEVNSKLLIDPINKKKNHAAKFVPSNDHISIGIINKIIDKNIQDKEIAIEMKQIVEEMSKTFSIEEIKKEIDGLITSYMNDTN